MLPMRELEAGWGNPTVGVCRYRRAKIWYLGVVPYSLNGRSVYDRGIMHWLTWWQWVYDLDSSRGLLNMHPLARWCETGVLYTGQSDGNWQFNDQVGQIETENEGLVGPSITRCTCNQPLHSYWMQYINQPLSPRLVTGQFGWPIWYGQFSSQVSGLGWG